MTPAIASDLFRSALWIAMQVAAPLLAVLTIVAVIFGILQAATQVQDASVSFTPKLAAAIGVLWMGGAWMTAVLGNFTHKVIAAIPWIVAR